MPHSSTGAATTSSAERSVPPVPGRIWQHECDGWYIYSNIGNRTKADDLKRISDHYHLGIEIEEGKPE